MEIIFTTGAEMQVLEKLEKWKRDLGSKRGWPLPTNWYLIRTSNLTTLAKRQTQ